MADMSAHPQASERAERTRTAPIFVPGADIYETEDALFLSLEMPGVSPDAVNIMLDQRVLTISGQSRLSGPDTSESMKRPSLSMGRRRAI